MSFWIVTDSCCDLSPDYIKAQNDFKVLPMNCQMDGISFVPDGSAESTHKFYDDLRSEKVATTSQINAEEWKSALRPILTAGNDALVIVFSSGLSGTYNAARIAKDELREEFPNQKLYVIDSLCASMGQGLLVHYALAHRAAGDTVEQAAAWVRENVQHLIHWFTVDDLQFLRRGGRVSATSAYLGGIMKIKPVLHVDYEGHLIPMEKVQGRKRSLRALVEKYQQFAVNPAEQTVFISHSDCLEDAQWVADKIREAGVKEIKINFIGPIIGSHTGPGTVALFFMGKGR